MIHYQLRCACGHAFDGWFPGSEAFERQRTAGLVRCPVCGGAGVDRGLMTPSVVSKSAEPIVEKTAPISKKTSLPATMPDQVRAVLQRMRAEVEQHCDHVGKAFPEEARRMHYGEIEPRGIYGNATPDEAEALAEEGITITPIPWVPPADS